VELIGGQAVLAESPHGYFQDLIRQANLPTTFVAETAGRWSANVFGDARWLLDWAAAKDVNPDDPRYTTLGSVLTPLLEQLGLQGLRDVAAVIQGPLPGCRSRGRAAQPIRCAAGGRSAR
jgi:hypothetical protein